DTTFSYVCALDEDDDPLNDPSCWKKANPLLGTILTDEYLAGVVAQGKAIPGKLNGILRLHFCVWTDAESAWLRRAVWEACEDGGVNATHNWASQLVGAETGIFADFVEFLRPMTSVGRFGAGNIPILRRVPVRTPLVGQASGGAGYWVGESQAKPL